MLRLHIDREPKRNALSGAVLRPMLAALKEPGDARVVLITSAGEPVFCSAAELRAETDALVTELAQKPPVAVRLGKAAFLAAMETTLAPGLEAIQAQLSLLNTTEDAAEGVGAFLQKRTPEWKGR